MQVKDETNENRQPVILFADDDKLCLDVIVQMLTRLGYSVLEATDGHEAAEVVANRGRGIVCGEDDHSTG